MGDPRITTEVYGHLVPDYLRAEIDRLSFGIAPPQQPSKDSQPLAGSTKELGPTLVQASQTRPESAMTGSSDASDIAGMNLWARRDSNPLPPASEAGTLSR